MAKKWTMPQWMEKYIDMINSTSNTKFTKADIEQIYNQGVSFSKTRIVIKANVNIFQLLHDKRLI